MPTLASRLAFILGSVGIDLRIGARGLAKEKGFCAIAMGVLALGIGAVTTPFAVVNGVLLRGFAFPAPDRLVTVEFGQAANEFDALVPRIMPADLLDLRARHERRPDDRPPGRMKASVTRPALSRKPEPHPDAPPLAHRALARPSSSPQVLRALSSGRSALSSLRHVQPPLRSPQPA